MKTLLVGAALIASMTFAGTAPAKPSDRPPKQDVGLLKQALGAVGATANAQGPKSPDQFSPKVDNDQGDDHANPGAILKVCGKDTPAANRAAICPVGISPD